MDCYEDTSAFKACLKTNVCPKSLMTNEMGFFITMESFCKDYHLPPLGKDTGYSKYPQILIDVFNVIGGTRDRMNMELIKEKQDS